MNDSFERALQMTTEQWRALRKEEGAKIDPETAEVMWQWASGLDPYGLHDTRRERDDYIARICLARAVEGEPWVWFGDLPDQTRERLWEKHKFVLAPFPGSLPPLEINTTARTRPRYLIVARAVLRPDAAYNLVYLKIDPSGGGQAGMMGWEWGSKLQAAPVKDFGYGILSHYIPVRELRPADELKMLVEQAHGRA